MVMAFFHNSRQECNFESIYSKGTEQKKDFFSVVGFLITSTQFLKTLDASINCADVRKFNLDWLKKIL